MTQDGPGAAGRMPSGKASAAVVGYPFGDTVDWDLIPDIAIDRINLEGSNPVFGLNALGGSVNVQLKNGFTYQGFEASLSGGSFGQIQGQFQYGKQIGNTSTYVAGNVLHQNGWRDASRLSNSSQRAGSRRRSSCRS
jgi:outer membrane cobalamin receptor